MKIHVISPTDNIDINTLPEHISLFLAGGCSTKWREEFVSELKKVINEKRYLIQRDVVIYTPFCDSSKIRLDDLITWEHDHILSADALVINFEGSESVQPGSLFELGRYFASNFNPIFINTSEKYKLLRELEIHVKLINQDRKKTFYNMSDIFLTKLPIVELVKSAWNVIEKEYRLH